MFAVSIFVCERLMSQSTPFSRSTGDNSSDTVSVDAVQLREEDVLNVLTHGQMDERGLLPYSSNYSFLVTVSDCEQTMTGDELAGDELAGELTKNELADGESDEIDGEPDDAFDNALDDAIVLPAVYKPRRGENSLWDFRSGTLCQREVAAYRISTTLGWGLVPPTVLRDGSHGVGSVQFYIANDEENHYFTVQDDARFVDTTRRLALFDYIINNADRKSGHCLVGLDERLWAIDHGICFHTEYKLRTVIWEFSGEPIADALLDDLERFHDQICNEQSDLRQQLCPLLNEEECAAVVRRTARLLRQRRYPSQHPHHRNFPWPPI